LAQIVLAGRPKEELAMKKMLVTTVLAAFGLAPTIGAACDMGMDDSSASAAPPAQMASTPAPAASKVPASATAKSVASNPLKQVAAKAKAPVPEQKVAVGATN
jgi:hypothetical protein